MFELGRTFDDEEVVWAPEREKNPHLAIVGASGTGKTQTVKSILSQGRKLGLSFLILDFHDEYVDQASRVIDVRKGIAINPLEVSESPALDNAYQIASVFRRLGLVGGDQQEAYFRRAILLSYGIDTDRSNQPLASLTPRNTPTFADVKKNLARLEATDSGAKRAIPSLRNRLGIVFDLNLFQRPTQIPFRELTTGTTVLSMKSLPTDETRALVSDFFLRKLWDFVYRLGPKPTVRLFCIADEAHRLSYQTSPVDRITREARKYGVGMILASQTPHDFADVVFANVSSKLCFRCSLEADANFMGRQMGCDPKQLMGLSEEGEAFIRLGSGEAPLRIRAHLFYRESQGEATEKPSSDQDGADEAKADETEALNSRFGGQVHFGKGGKLKGTASLKNWRETDSR